MDGDLLAANTKSINASNFWAKTFTRDALSIQTTDRNHQLIRQNPQFTNRQKLHAQQAWFRKRPSLICFVCWEGKSENRKCALYTSGRLRLEVLTEQPLSDEFLPRNLSVFTLKINANTAVFSSPLQAAATARNVGTNLAITNGIPRKVPNCRNSDLCWNNSTLNEFRLGPSLYDGKSAYSTIQIYCMRV